MDKDIFIRFERSNPTNKANEKDYERFYDLVLKRGEIRKYAKNTNLFGDYNVGYCLILNDSLKLDSRVLICPLFFQHQIENKVNLKLVKFDTIIDGEPIQIYGSLFDIRFISKRKFIEFGNGENKIEDEIHLGVVHKILEIYLLFLTHMLIENKKETPIAC